MTIRVYFSAWTGVSEAKSAKREPEGRADGIEIAWKFSSLKVQLRANGFWFPAWIGRKTSHAACPETIRVRLAAKLSLKKALVFTRTRALKARGPIPFVSRSVPELNRLMNISGGQSLTVT